MNVNDIYASSRVAAADLQGKQPKLTIAAVDVAVFDEGRKLEVHFVGAGKTLILNRTNTSVIADAYGPETDDWIGKEIILYTDRVPFQGKMVDAVRVRVPTPPPADATDSADIPW